MLLKSAALSLTCALSTSLAPIAAQASVRAGMPMNVRVMPSWRESILAALNKTDGALPHGGAVTGRDGALYGTASWGGLGWGTVFRLAPHAGSWSLTVLHVFNINKDDGAGPQAAVSFGLHGELYGTTDGGGTDCGNFGFACGTVYELVPARNHTWNEFVLANFPGGNGGGNSPQGSVLVGPTGALYGTTAAGGKYNCGTTFRLTRGSGGQWTMAVLHGFTGGNDGCFPTGSLIMDQRGALYGTTNAGGGTQQGGVVYQLSPRSNGNWRLETLHAFTGVAGGDGALPMSGVISDSTGTLYGTTSEGGSYACGGNTGCGTVFALDPPPRRGSPWIERILYAFLGGSDGETPYAGITLGGDGALYGATSFGGGLGPCTSGCGTVFALRPTLGYPTGYAEAILHRFSGGADGSQPFPQTLLLDGRALYGTTIMGGAGSECSYGCGTVFALSAP